jgi:hypothetical protein
MNTRSIATVALMLLAGTSSAALAETIDTRIGKLEMNGSYPTDESIRKLYDERDFQRATQAYIWALPIVAMANWQKAHEEIFGAQSGDVVVYDDFVSKRGILTANATTPYVISFFNLAETGPVVIDMPEGSVAGFVNDMWQRPVIDMGQTGPDKGKGGKYLIVGPGQKVENTDGYYVVEPSTLNIFWGFRALEKDPAKVQQLLDALKIYPLAKKDNPAKVRFVDVKGKAWSQTQPRGLDYWKVLSAIVNREPVQERDRLFMAMLKPLGIEKGKPFKPDERQAKLLNEGTVVGEAMAKANDFEKHFPAAHYADGRQWEFALALDPSQRAENYDELDERAAWFYEATTTSSGMVTTTPGVGQIYLGTYKDKSGNWLDGSKTYRLRVAPNAPVANFWSMTVYDTDTRALVDNPGQQADRSSRMDLKKNADDSVDIYVGPKAPTGLESNWVQSLPGKSWFSYFRLYGPTEAFFDRSWVLNDIEEINH